MRARFAPFDARRDFRGRESRPLPPPRVTDEWTLLIMRKNARSVGGGGGRGVIRRVCSKVRARRLICNVKFVDVAFFSLFFFCSKPYAASRFACLHTRNGGMRGYLNWREILMRARSQCRCFIVGIISSLSHCWLQGRRRYHREIYGLTDDASIIVSPRHHRRCLCVTTQSSVFLPRLPHPPAPFRIPSLADSAFAVNSTIILDRTLSTGVSAFPPLSS